MTVPTGVGPTPGPLPDPYTPGQVPRVLAGRAVELGRIRDRLGRVASFGELAGPLLVFHAPRGLGKTSLLRTAEREAAASASRAPGWPAPGSVRSSPSWSAASSGHSTGSTCGSSRGSGGVTG